MKAKHSTDITLYYREGDKHSITETWHVGSRRQFDKVIGQALDMFVDKKGCPCEPDYNKLTENLSKYADKKFIDSEYKRMKKMYKIYKSTTSLDSPTLIFPVRIDSRTKLDVVGWTCFLK